MRFARQTCSKLAARPGSDILQAMSTQTFRWEHRVTYAECTAGNHVYYSRFLDILEAARGEFFRHLGRTFLHWQENDTIFPVVECQLRYRSAARYDEVLAIELWLTTAAKVRLDFAYQIKGPDGRLLIEAATRHVCTTLEDKPQRLPAELIANVAPYLSGTPES